MRCNSNARIVGTHFCLLIAELTCAVQHSLSAILILVVRRHYLAKAMRFTKDESADGNRRVWNALVSAALSALLAAP